MTKNNPLRRLITRSCEFKTVKNAILPSIFTYFWFVQTIKAIVICVICFLQLTVCFSQNDTLILPQKPTHKPALFEIKMQDGTSYTGYIQHQTDSVIYLKSHSGIILQIPKHSVQNIHHIIPHSLHDTIGGIPVYNPVAANKYYVAGSNAFLFKPREVYGNSSYFLLYSIHYAFNQHVSLGLLSSPLLIPAALRLKVNFEVAPKLYLGVDGLFGSGSWLSSKSYGWGGLVKLTYGELKKNFTVFAGYGNINYTGISLPFRGGGMGRRRGGSSANNGGSYGSRIIGVKGLRGGLIKPEDYNTIIVGAATAIPIFKKISFVAEAYAFPQLSSYSILPGFRTTGKRNISWVLSFEGTFNVGTYTSFSPFFYVGFSYKF